MAAPKLTLNSGKEIPQLGFGTWLAAPGVVGESVQTAIKVPFKIKSNNLKVFYDIQERSLYIITVVDWALN